MVIGMPNNSKHFFNIDESSEFEFVPKNTSKKGMIMAKLKLSISTETTMIATSVQKNFFLGAIRR